MATTDTKGEFGFQGVSLGKYVIFYNLSGQSINNITVEVNDKSAGCLASGFLGSMPEDCRGSIPFGDDSSMTLGKDSSIAISGTGFTLAEGSIFSQKYDLYLNFEDSQPLNVEIEPGETSEIEIKVWAQ